jgi:hypothetical protein
MGFEEHRLSAASPSCACDRPSSRLVIDEEELGHARQTSCGPKWLQPLTRYVMFLQADILENMVGLA